MGSETEDAYHRMRIHLDAAMREEAHHTSVDVCAVKEEVEGLRHQEGEQE